MPAELRGVESQCLVEGAALVVIEVHGDVHGEAEELGPGLGNGALEEVWMTLQESCQEVAVPAAHTTQN